MRVKHREFLTLLHDAGFSWELNDQEGYYLGNTFYWQAQIVAKRNGKSFQFKWNLSRPPYSSMFQDNGVLKEIADEMIKTAIRETEKKKPRKHASRRMVR